MNNGIALKQIIEHEVIAIDEATITTKFTLHQDAEPQTVKNPTLPPNISVKLDSVDTQGQGTTVFDLHSILPIEHHNTVKSKINLTVTVGEKTQKTNTQLNMNVELKSPELDSPELDSPER